MKRLVSAVRRCARKIVRDASIVSGLLLCMITASADANPTGGQVTHGTASINYGQNMTVNIGSSNVIINWETFGIAAGERLDFLNMASSWRVLSPSTASCSFNKNWIPNFFTYRFCLI